MAPRPLERPERMPARVRGNTERKRISLTEIKSLIDLIEGTDLTTLSWARGGERIVLKRGQVHPAPSHSTAVAQAPAPTSAPRPSAAAAPAPEAKPGATVN